MKKEKRLKKLEKAQRKLSKCIELLEESVGDNAYLDSYLITPLRVRVGDQEYLTNDPSIQSVMDDIYRDEYEE